MRTGRRRSWGAGFGGRNWNRTLTRGRSAQVGSSGASLAVSDLPAARSFIRTGARGSPARMLNTLGVGANDQEAELGTGHSRDRTFLGQVGMSISLGEIGVELARVGERIPPGMVHERKLWRLFWGESCGPASASCFSAFSAGARLADLARSDSPFLRCLLAGTLIFTLLNEK
jgi:hypothetical protein